MTYRIFEGATAGFLATVPMTLAMASIRKGVGGKKAPLPMEEVGEGVTETVALRGQLTGNQQDAFNWVSHFAFGAATGGIFGLLTARDPKTHAVEKGILFGMAVWITSYGGVLPAAGIIPRLKQEPKHKIASEVISHIVWGAGLGLVSKRLSKT